MTLLFILLILVLVYIVYTLLAELLFHIWHVRTIYKGLSSRRSVALTFDDGPDARYTPEVLNILKSHHVKATFFLVAKRAVAAPEIVQSIVADGHEVASHGHRHVHAWTLGPVSTWRNIFESKRTLESFTGTRLRYYRPPWGAFNWMTRIAAFAAGLRPVLWSLRAKDWYAGDYTEDVFRRVVDGAHPGAIVLSHDAGGGEGAPLNTIRALPSILKKLSQLGYHFETVGEMVEHAQAQQRRLRDTFLGYPLMRRLLIHCWTLVEVTFARLYHIQGVNEMFRVSSARWTHGTRVDQSTGQVLMQDGLPTLDLHIQNESVIAVSATDDNRALIRALRLTKEGFKDLARMLQHDGKLANVRAVMATTLMNRGMEMLGFHVEDLPDTPQKRQLKRHMYFLMGLYHPEGFRRLKQGHKALEVRLIWMTREEMIERYGDRV